MLKKRKKLVKKVKVLENFIKKKEKMVAKIRNRKNLQSRKLVAKNKALEKLVKN